MQATPGQGFTGDAPPPDLPVVYRDANGHPLIVLAKGRKYYHAVSAGTTIRLVTRLSLDGLTPMELAGKPYPVKRAARAWLGKDHRTITPRAKVVLRDLTGR